VRVLRAAPLCVSRADAVRVRAAMSAGPRVRKKRGGKNAASLVAARRALAAERLKAARGAADAREKLFDVREAQYMDEKGKSIVPLARCFMRAYAKHYAAKGSRVPSDLQAMLVGVRCARRNRLPTWYVPFIVMAKYGPSIKEMVRFLSSRQRPGPQNLSAHVSFLVSCAVKVREAHEKRMAVDHAETKNWTLHYQAAMGQLGPMACGSEDSAWRSRFEDRVRKVAMDRELHRLLSSLEDGQLGCGAIEKLKKKLQVIFPSKYVGQWVIRSTLWCCASCEGMVELVGNYATSGQKVLCTKAANEHIGFAESREAFKESSPFLVGMHLCFAESMQNQLMDIVPHLRTPSQAAAWVSKPRVSKALAAARRSEERRIRLEPRPDLVVVAFVASPAAAGLLRC
jgi:hypothetical protein